LHYCGCLVLRYCFLAVDGLLRNIFMCVISLYCWYHRRYYFLVFHNYDLIIIPFDNTNL
jgi:hypothetical protein